MSRATDNATFAAWQLQRRLGIKPADRRLPSNDNVDAFERDLATIRELMAAS